MQACTICPRECSALRSETPSGFCGAPDGAVVCRAAPHFGEEPCISGVRGSGAVFFAGCNLRCVFCQNRAISRGTSAGKAVTDSQLRDIFERLRSQNVHNINLVTPSHFTPAIIRALEGFSGVPVVWNSSAYEKPETIRQLEGLVNVYLPDMKYSDSSCAAGYSAAADYPERAKSAILEMYRRTGPCRFDDDGMLISGVLIRHLMLPGALDNTLGVIDWVASAFPTGSVMFSLMSQYTPPSEGLELFPELQTRVSQLDYDAAVSYMELCGLSFGYTQEPCSATEELLPEFDGTGI